MLRNCNIIIKQEDNEVLGLATGYAHKVLEEVSTKKNDELET